MSINIQRDIRELQEYVSSSNFQTTGLLRGRDGVLRQVTISDDSSQIAVLSNIIKEILNNPSVVELSREDFHKFIDVVKALPSKERFLKEVVLKGISIQKLMLGYDQIEERFLSDKEIVLVAVKNSGRVLKYASAELINDEEVVLAAVLQNGWALEYASDALKNNKEVVLAAVSQNGWALQFASNALKNDKDVVLAAIKKDWGASKYASIQLQNDKEVVIATVRQNGRALKYVSTELKNDKDVVLAAVTNDGEALKYASDALKNDKKIIFAALRQNRQVLKDLNSKASKNKSMQLAAQIYHNQPIDIANLSVQTLFEEWYTHLNHHVNSPVLNTIIEVFDDPKLRDFEKRQLLINLFDSMIFFTDEIITSDSASRIIHAIFTLAHPAARGRLIELFNQLSLSELKAISLQIPEKITNKTQFEIRTKVLLTRLNSVIVTSKLKLDIAEIVYANFLKDTKMQVILFSYLEMVINICPQLNEDQKNKLILRLQIDLRKPLKLELIKKFALLTSMGTIFGKDAIIEVSDKPLEEIEAYFAKEFNSLFQGKSMLQDSELLSQVASLYQETFAKFRDPMAIFTYLKSVKQVEPEVKAALCEYVYHVLKGDFYQFKNEQLENQPHLAKLYQKEGLKELWLKEPLSVKLTDSGIVKDLDIAKFFYQKVVIDNHFQDEVTSQSEALKEYLKQVSTNASVDHRPYLQMLEEQEHSLLRKVPFDQVLLVRNQLEVLIIKLCSKAINIETFKKEREALYIDGSVRKNEVEKALSNDFELLYQPTSAVSSVANYTLQLSTDPNDLLLLGTEVQGSCQNINGQPHLNKCLLGYMINGESQAIVIKDSNKRIVGRAIIRLLSDHKGNPVLFLERLYLNKLINGWRNAIVSIAKEKAKTMGVPLLSKEVGDGKLYLETLHFRGGRAPFIYSDASGGVLNGQQEFVITGAHILFKP